MPKKGFHKHVMIRGSLYSLREISEWKGATGHAWHKGFDSSCSNYMYLCTIIYMPIINMSTSRRDKTICPPIPVIPIRTRLRITRNESLPSAFWCWRFRLSLRLHLPLRRNLIRILFGTALTHLFRPAQSTAITQIPLAAWAAPPFGRHAGVAVCAVPLRIACTLTALALLPVG